MANPIIDAITWNANNTAASIRNLQTQLALLQAEWVTKLERQEQITSADPVLEVDWLSLAAQKGIEADDPNVQYQWFNPSVPELQGISRFIYDRIRSTDSRIRLGNSEFVEYTFDNNVAESDGNPGISQNITLLESGYLYGRHNFKINYGSNNSVRETQVFIEIDGVPIYGVDPAIQDTAFGFPYINPVTSPAEDYNLYFEWVSDKLVAGAYDVTLNFIIIAQTWSMRPTRQMETTPIAAATLANIDPQMSTVEIIYIP